MSQYITFWLHQVVKNELIHDILAPFVVKKWVDMSHSGSVGILKRVGTSHSGWHLHHNYDMKLNCLCQEWDACRKFENPSKEHCCLFFLPSKNLLSHVDLQVILQSSKTPLGRFYTNYIIFRNVEIFKFNQLNFFWRRILKSQEYFTSFKWNLHKKNNLTKMCGSYQGTMAILLLWVELL